MSNHPETILQFGTGKFLRAFADLFVQEQNEQGRGAGRIVALQSTGVERAELLNRQGGRYHVAIRGLEQGQRVDRAVEVESIRRSLAAQTDWNEVLAAACQPPLTTIVSNTTEAGYALAAEDKPTDAPPRSFPAKLLAILQARFDYGQAGLTILPCELLEHNGNRLLQLVLTQAERWGRAERLIDWLRNQCVWCNTLVDRIVSAPSSGDPLAAQDPLFAVAEPFALWLIERLPPDSPFAGHPAVRRVDQLEPYHLRKVRILNGAHTALVAKALPLGFQTVREAVLDPQIGSWLKSLLAEEIVPTLEGRTENPQAFALEVLQRFANPFLEHRLADIALHHDVKLQTRLMPTYREYRERFGHPPRLLGEILPGL